MMFRLPVLITLIMLVVPNAFAADLIDLRPAQVKYGQCWVFAAAGDAREYHQLGDHVMEGIDGLDEPRVVALFLYTLGANAGDKASAEKAWKLRGTMSESDIVKAGIAVLNANFIFGRSRVDEQAGRLEPMASRIPKRNLSKGNAMLDGFATSKEGNALMLKALGGDATSIMSLAEQFEKNGDKGENYKSTVFALYGLAHMFGHQGARAEMDRFLPQMSGDDVYFAGSFAANPVDLYGYREEFGVEIPKRPSIDYREEFGVE